MTESIPPEYRQTLLPNPLFSVSKLLTFPLPSQSLVKDTVDTRAFYSFGSNHHCSDSVVPHDAVADDLHGELPDTVDQHFVRGEDGVVSAAEAEETLIEEVEGVVLDTTGAVAEELGRGKRKKLRNGLYTTEALKWWVDTRKTKKT